MKRRDDVVERIGLQVAQRLREVAVWEDTETAALCTRAAFVIREVLDREERHSPRFINHITRLGSGLDLW